MRARLLQQVPVSDGVHLLTDVWLPDGHGPFPVLVTRTPYQMFARQFPFIQTYTEWGYAYVIQYTRGKYGSEGEFRPPDEARDGQDTIAWIAGQEWCNGRIGMVGGSYKAIVQIPAAAGGNESLRCIVPEAGPTSFFRDWIRYDGCFALANAIYWSLVHATCATVPTTLHFTWDELHRKATLEEVFQRVGFGCPILQDWVDHDSYDGYWRKLDQDHMYRDVAVPGMHVGGWFDHHIRGTVGSYSGIRDQGASEKARVGQLLLVGPWGHNTLNATGQPHREYGEWDFGADASLAVLDEERKFIDRWMRDEDSGSLDDLPVKVFLMGENRWICLKDWPPAEAVVQKWYLTSSGSGCNCPRSDGQLSLEPPAEMPPDEYLYDPRDPVPTLGGPIFWGISPGGPVDQSPILGRSDVILYCSEPLGRSLAVVGEISLDLWVTSSAPDTDFVAKLCVVGLDGRVTCLTLGSIRSRFRESWSDPQPLQAGTPTRLQIQMAHTAYVFPERARIALIVTSSDFPRILPHPNTMAPTWTETSPQVARQQVLHSQACPSCLRLPVLEL